HCSWVVWAKMARLHIAAESFRAPCLSFRSSSNVQQERFGIGEGVDQMSNELCCIGAVVNAMVEAQNKRQAQPAFDVVMVDVAVGHRLKPRLSHAQNRHLRVV